MSKIKFAVIFSIIFFGVLFFARDSLAATSVSQYGITWSFDRDYTTGQFANGDYWVVGPVVITAITPAYNGQDNGWEVNPMPGVVQGFDTGCPGFLASKVPSLPYTAQAGQSIVKAVSAGTGYNCLSTAAVLTVVSAVPPNSGTTVFRPPYVGTAKPYYSTNDLQTNLLPSLTPAGTRPTLSWIYEAFRRVQLDHGFGGYGRPLHPILNMPDYGSDIATRNADGALGLMLNDPLSAKMNALVVYVQYGIDLYHMVINGQTWPDGGGWRPGQKLPLAFAATMLNNQNMINYVSAIGFLDEDTAIQPGINNNPVFGQVDTASRYWNYIATCSGSSLELADPYGFIDGGCPTNGYQGCCLNKAWKSEAIAVVLIPTMQANWMNWNRFIKYVDRFVNVGTWTQPDPCAPSSQGGGPASNPAGCVLDPDLAYFNSTTDFACQAGRQCGRFPTQHGIDRDQGGHYSPFAEAMWEAYRNSSTDSTPPTVSLTAPASGSTVSGTSVTVSANASDNVGVIGVQFRLNGTNLGSEDTSVPYSITWNTTQATNGSHTLTATARDAAGNQTISSGVSVTVSNATFDTQAPTVPTNLSATAVSSSQINLSWSASSDNVGVTGYRIYRNGQLVNSLNSLTYSDTGLSSNTTYSYTVAAYDAVPNVSGQSSQASATTQSVSGGVIYYVATTGNDSNSGSQSQPWRTIQRAANAVTAGNTVIVQTGTYPERITFSSGHSGTSAAKITFRADPRRSVTMNGFNTANVDYLRVEGFNITTTNSGGGVYISSSGVEVIDNYFYDIPRAAIQPNGYRNNITVSNNRIYRSQAGIWAVGTNWLVSNNEVERLYYWGSGDCDYSRFFGDTITFRNNYFHGTIASEIGDAHTDGFQTWDDNFDRAINITLDGNFVESFHQGIIVNMTPGRNSALNYIIKNNIFSGGAIGGNTAIDINAVTNVSVYNNVIYDINLYGIRLLGGSTGTVRNNILYNAGVPQTYTGSTITGGTNIIYTGNGYFSTDIVANPLFLNTASMVGADGIPFTSDDGYRLQSGSLARNAGYALSGIVDTDIFGTSRPQGSAWDIGAHEYVVTGVDTTPPTVPSNLSASAVSSSQINLTWTASSDNVGVTGYRIYRAGTQIGTSASNSYSDTGLTANATYSYTVAAYDAVPNVSGQSASALATTQSQSLGNITTGLVGYWSLDETSGITAFDSSGAGNTGTLVNGPVWTTGRIGGALSFDGVDDYVNAGDINALDGLSAMTISMWMRPIALATTKGVISKWGNNQNSWGIRTTNSAADEFYIFIANALTDGGGNYFTTSNLDLANNVWSHLVIVYDGTLAAANRVAVYKNATAVSGSITGTIPTTLTSASSAVNIGFLLSGYLNMTADEVRIYNRALSASEVSQLYNYTGSVDTTPPAAPTGVRVQ